MEHYNPPTMDTKTKKMDILHIRVDADLNTALALSAHRADRKYTDQARWLLRAALGLARQDEDAMVLDRFAPPALVRAQPAALDALSGLDHEERDSVTRLVRTLRSAAPEVRRHMIARLKITERAVQARQARAQKKGRS